MYFNCLLRPVYPEIVKDFWKHACVSSSNQIFLSVMGNKICVTEEMVEKLINNDGSRNRYYKIPPIMEKLDEMANVIFQNGKDSCHAKKLHKILEFGSRLSGLHSESSFHQLV